MSKSSFIYRISIFVTFLCFCYFMNAQDTIKYHGNVTKTKTVNFRTYTDSTCSSTLKDIKNQISTNIKSNFSTYCYWHELIIENKSNENCFSIEFNDPHVDKIELYSGEKLLFKSGYGRDIKQRTIHHKNHIFLLDIPKKTTKVYYVKFQNRVPASFSGIIKPLDTFINYSLGEYIALGIFYGILLLLLVYNFILYFTIRKKQYLFYVLYLFSCCIVTFNENGLGFQYIWSSFPEINYLLYKVDALLLALSFLAYSVSFYGFKAINKKTVLYISVSLLISTLLFRLSNIPQYWPIIYIIFFTYILYLTSYKLKQEKPLFSFFTTGNILLIFSYLILFLRITDIIPSNAFTVYFFNIGFVIEGVIFSYAMANNLNDAHLRFEESQQKIIVELQEKEALKTKVNRELENAVTERTQTIELQKQELVNLNDELKEYQKKIDYINSELDKDNWKLKKSLTQAKKEKILKRVTSYKEFCTVFKTNFECTKHLEELKWSNGFKCRKCTSSNYSIVAKTKNRKCTNCKHIESPTANTLYHGVKFPLNKAFYITYLTHYSKKKRTVDELSLELELRRNTLWNFRKKVVEKKAKLMEEGQIKGNAPWEDLIIG